MDKVSSFVASHQDLVDDLLKEIDRSQEILIERTRRIAEIPSPTFHEEKRTGYVLQALAGAGLKDVHSLPLGSVVGFTRSGQDPDMLLLAAHIDTVFSQDTDLKTRLEVSRLYGPGTGDNSANVAAIITLAEMLGRMPMGLNRNVAFCGTVREEAIGNLGGMAEVLQALEGKIGTVIAVDGRMPSLMHRSPAIRRFLIEVSGPGGHSWEHFGTASAVHEMARLVVAISSFETPAEPKTSVNVGTIWGGRSVNAIAQECAAQIEFRSLETRQVERLEKELKGLVDTVSAADIHAGIELIGTRPAALQPSDSDLVKSAVATAEYLGIKPRLTTSSTDAALSLSRGIPSISLGTYRGKGVHTLQEQVETDSLTLGLKWLALTVLVLAGIRT